ncbi:MAG: TonB-dependent receptor [Parapedobacter sp.]|nr:MAG: TonB-dependent receptor [Parapedobacter sp.]
MKRKVNKVARLIALQKWLQISLAQLPIRKLCLVLIFVCSCIVLAFGQIKVRGYVTDRDNRPLSGVSIVVEGSAISTSTNNEGYYEISVPAADAILSFSHVGLIRTKQKVAGKTDLNVVMEESGQSLDEVVVIGYGSQSRGNVTTSISKLDNRVLENVSFPNVGTALQGNLPGVRVQTTSGQPGMAPRIIVRGGTSINNPNGAAPLYIVDGVIRSINNIASEDIESIQVLKDASSTAIYGARASNGVVIITTKSGAPGKTQVAYTFDVSASEVNRLPQMASAEQYITLARQGTVNVSKKLPQYEGRLNQPLGYGIGNDFTKNTDYTVQLLSDDNRHKLNEGWTSILDPVDPSRTIIFKETDFRDLALQTAISQNHHLSISGGSEMATFNAGLGYLKSNGTAITTFFDRLTFNLNGDIKANDKLQFFARTMFSQAVDNRLIADSYTFWGAATRPTAKYKYEDGTLAPGRINQGNPDYHMRNRDDENRGYNLTVAGGSKWDILPGLSFNALLSLNGDIRFNRTFQPAYGNGGGQVISTRQASGSDSRNMTTQADGVFNYSKEFDGLHQLDANAGFSYFKRNNYSHNSVGQGASTDLIPTLNASSQFVSLSSVLSDFVLVGYFGRIGYNYDDRFIATASLRYDGASNLGEENYWGVFPGASVGWNIHNESFWENNLKYLSQLKLRASYGVNGNISGLGDFTAQGIYSVGGQYAGSPVIRNTGIPNPGLRWEQSNTINVGLDLGVFNNRLTTLIDVYRRVTDNLLTTLPLPASTGFTGILTNYGALENRGVEVELNLKAIPNRKDLSWDLSFNIASVKNKILELPSNGMKNNRVGGYYVWDSRINDYEWLGGLQEGGRVGDYFAYKQLGVYARDEDAANAPTDLVSPTADKTKYGGDVIWLDADGNGQIDTRDMAFVGNQFPKITGGGASYLQYKNVGLTVRFDFTTGHTIYNYGRAFYDANLDGDNVMTKSFADNSWKKQGDVTNVPRYDWQDATEFNIRRGNSSYYEKGDYLALREVTLYYDLPTNLLSRVKINGVRIHATGNNLHYFTKFSGLNPEDGGQEFGRYPIPRNFIIGVNLNL